jgi:prophage regulatory protein
MCQFVFIPTSPRGSQPNDPRRCKRPAWKDGWCKIHHPSEVRRKISGDCEDEEGKKVYSQSETPLSYLAKNLNDATEFRDKFDFLVKKVCEIQAQLGALTASSKAESGSTKEHVRSSEAAKIIGVSAGTLWRYVNEQPGFPIPMKPSPGCTLFSVAELRGWMESVRVVPKKARAGKTRGQHA